MKYLKTFEGKYTFTYGEAKMMSEFDSKIKQYIEDNYPEHGYNAIRHHPMKNGKYQTTKKFITYGKSLGVGQAKKILALAKRKKDIELLGLLNHRFKNIEEVEMGMTANKYNI